MSAATTTYTPAIERRRQRKYFDSKEFNALHDAAGKLDFTPVFNPSIEAILDMEDVPLIAKVLAIYQLQGWGNQNKFPVHDVDRTKPFTQSDIARRLSVSTSAVGRVVAKLYARYQLSIEDGVYYPEPDPDAEKRRRESEPFPHGWESPSQNLRFWLANYPELEAEYLSAFKTIEKIKKKFKQESKKNASHPGGISEASVPDRQGSEKTHGREDSEPPGGTPEAPSLNRTTDNFSEGPQCVPVLSTSVVETGENRTQPNHQSETGPSFAALRFAAQQNNLSLPTGHIDWCQHLWFDLPVDQRIAAMQGIESKRAAGEYPDHAPRLLKYLKEQLWTEKPRVQYTKTDPDIERKAAASAAFDRRFMRELEEQQKQLEKGNNA